MEKKIISNSEEGMVAEMRRIRDQISLEIKDMTFDEERLYLDQLIKGSEKIVANPSI